MKAPQFLRSLQWRIAVPYTALILVSISAISLYLISFLRETYISNLEQRLAQEAALLSETLNVFLGEHSNVDVIQEESEQAAVILDSRITIIDRDGTVLADTWEDAKIMENHRDRPEVVGALNSGLGKSVRYSNTVQSEMYYVAVPIKVEDSIIGVVRIAIPSQKVQGDLNRLVAATAASAFVVALLSVALSYFLARQTSISVHMLTEGARRIAEGDLEHRVQSTASDETQELADAFNRMAAALRTIVSDLSEERNKLSAVLDTMADAVVVVGPDREIMLLNKAAEELFSIRSSRVVGRRFVETIRDYDLQRLISDSMATGEQQSAQTELLPSRRYLSVIATPLVEDGAMGVLLILHDLTRMRQIETTRREFVSNVSHELRSPLASIKAMVETLEDGALDEREVAVDFLSRVHQEVDRLTSMVNELLELASLESGQTVVQAEPIGLRELIDSVKRQFQIQASLKKVALDVDIPPDLPDLFGEEEKLRRVVVNLVDNALKFTPEGGTIRLSALTRDGFVEVRVKDSGVGIPREHLPHVFERFYKVDRSRRDRGTGLGLAIVKHLVLAHGGDVRAESREGSGSEFIFTVPKAV